MILQDERKQKALLYTTLVAGCMATINTSTVNIALPTFIEIFHTDLSTAQWLMIGYMLALGIVMPMVGYFGERYSYRRMYLTALLFMAVFALGCALSCNIGMLILFRILKGLAAGFILPLYYDAALSLHSQRKAGQLFGPISYLFLPWALPSGQVSPVFC